MRRYGVALALGATLLAGCSDEHAGSLPSLAPAPPAPSPADVAAVARDYYAALEQAGQTGDVARLRALVDPACACADQVGYIEREHRAGHRFTTRYTVDGVTTHDVTAGSAYATVTITYADSAVVDAKGGVVRRLPGKTRAGRDLLFEREGAAWRLARLVVLG
jgi:predicted lipid-binding transport protein (Tim44 family)